MYVRITYLKLRLRYQQIFSIQSDRVIGNLQRWIEYKPASRFAELIDPDFFIRDFGESLNTESQYVLYQNSDHQRDEQCLSALSL